MSDHHRGSGIDVDELTRRAFFEADELEPKAKERTRAQLRAAFARSELISVQSLPTTGARPKRTRPPRVAIVAVAAALAVVAVVLTLVLPPGQGGPTLSGAQELRRLGAVARAQSVGRALEPGEYLYSSIEESLAHGQTYIGDGSFTFVQRDSVELWVGADASARRTTVVRDVRFPSAEDREAWRSLGSPPLPDAGERTSERFDPGEFLFYDLDGLPTDPNELAPLIHGQSVIEHGKGDDLVFYAIGTLLAQGGSSPEIRSALFDVAAELSDVRSLGTVIDPLGREGIGIEVAHSGGQTRLIFDPATSALLAQERIAPMGEGSTPLVQWSAFQQTVIVSSEGSRRPA